MRKFGLKSSALETPDDQLIYIWRDAICFPADLVGCGQDMRQLDRDGTHPDIVITDSDAFDQLTVQRRRFLVKKA